MDINPSEKLKSLRRELAYRLSKISSTKPFDTEYDFVFHGTIAFKDIDNKFDRILNYIEHKQEPNIHQHLLRITIIKNNRILYEYDLMQKKILKQKTSDYNQDLEKKESFFDKIKDFLKWQILKWRV